MTQQKKIFINGKPLKTDINSIIAKRLTKKRQNDADFKKRTVCADYRGRAFYRSGNSWRLKGEKEKVLYRRTQKRKKLGVKPNPLRNVKTTHKGLLKRHQRTIEKNITKRKKPIPVYEDQGWQFVRVWPPKPKPKKKKVDPIPFIEFLENPNKYVYGKTTFQKAILSDIDYWLKWNDSNSDYSLKGLIDSMVQSYKPNFENKPDWEHQFKVMLKSMLKQNKNYLIWQTVDNAVGFDFHYEDYSQYHLMLVNFKPKLELIYYTTHWYDNETLDSNDLSRFIKNDKYELNIEIGESNIRKKTLSEKDEEEENSK